jgi:hypothetical protein
LARAGGLGRAGKYEDAPEKVRFDRIVADDEIDLDSGFIMVPLAIPLPAPVPGPGPTPPGSGSGPVPPGPDPQPPGPTPPGPTPPPEQAETRVQLSFAADRNALFTAWTAMANLADLAGRVRVTVEAESPVGFDKSKLHNGVLEPLREADLIE